MYKLPEDCFPDGPPKCDARDGRIVLEPWPDIATFSIYDGVKHPFITARSDIPLSTMLYAVSDEYVVKLFQDKFWDEEVASQGVKALIPTGRHTGHTTRQGREISD